MANRIREKLTLYWQKVAAFCRSSCTGARRPWQSYHEKLAIWWAPQGAKLALFWQPYRVKMQGYYQKAEGRWQEMQERERRWASIGGAALALFLFYSLIWSPLNSSVDELREEIQREQRTWAWVKEADKKMQALEKKQQPPSSHSQLAQLNALQQKIQISPIAAMLTQLVQTGPDELRVSFANVDFDQLMTWLIRFSQQEGFTVTQATVQRGTALEIVQADFVFKL